MLHGEGEQVDICHLARAVDVKRVHPMAVEEADGAGPELVILSAGRAAQPIDGFGRRNRARVLRLADDADKAVLRQGAGRPAVLDLRGDPVRWSTWSAS